LATTLARVQHGELEIYGRSVRQRAAIRSQLGIVFQSPSLDPKLSVLENIRCQATLYGLRGKAFEERLCEVSGQLSLSDRLDSKVEELSGGLKRRVELAKGILHRPKLLLMDEPSTGLDPAARLDLWHALKELQQDYDVTILLTTHLLEEAEKADRIAIMDQGQVVALGEPSQLRNSLGEQILRVQTTSPTELLPWLEAEGFQASRVDGQIRISGTETASLVAPMMERFGSQVQNVTLGQPGLEDVFIAKTGHRFPDETETEETTTFTKKRKRH
jgi:ABC-2 type transport system ATP-binding protein